MSSHTARYTPGGDEHLFVELSPEMSLQAYFKSAMITAALRDSRIEGVTEICPANASYQVRYDPDVINVSTLTGHLKELEAQVGEADGVLATRIIEIPVFYDDPWTREVQARFRDRHQDPEATDLEYAARVNGYPDVASFIAAHSGTPWFVSMVGFVAGLPFMYQMVERERQIQVPKYLRPRTDTPKLTIGYGGCFSCIYSVRGAGGYQMFGVTPVPIYDPQRQVPHLRDFMVFFRPGDIVSFRPIGHEEHDDIAAAVSTGDYAVRMQDVHFSTAEFMANPTSYPARLKGALDVQ